MMEYNYRLHFRLDTVHFTDLNNPEDMVPPASLKRLREIRSDLTI